MKNKILLTLMIGMFLFSLVGIQAGDFDSHKQNTDFTLTISGNEATSCNTTWIKFPNGSSNILNIPMTKDGTTFYTTIESGNFSSLGTTCLGLSCTDGSQNEVGSKCLDVTPEGYTVSEGSGIIYSILFLGTLVLFIISLYYGLTLPWKNNSSEEGDLLSIDYKKYLKMFLLFTSYLILTFTFAIGKGMSNDFLMSDGAYGFFNVGFSVLLIGIMPSLIALGYFVIASAIFDKKVQRAIERGLPVR